MEAGVLILLDQVATLPQSVPMEQGGLDQTSYSGSVLTAETMSSILAVAKQRLQSAAP